MKIGARITAMAVVPIVATAAIVLGIALLQKTLLRDFFTGEIDRQARSEAQKVVQSVYLMCRSAQESVQQTVDANLRVAEDILLRHGPISFDRATVTWQARNQFDQTTRSITLPRLLIGGQWPGQNFDLALPAPVVDATRDLVGGTVTIFQRMNPQGDMLRVVTNVPTANGRRAIATYIPAVEPDGQPNPVIAALLRGETFRGRAFVVNAWYITAYQPLRDAGGAVIGALYVGVRQENLQSLRRGIMDIRVGQDGYVWVVGGHGNDYGRYIISKQGQRDGESLLDIRDESGEFFVRRMVARALALPAVHNGAPIPVAFDRYPWKNPGEHEPRTKSVALAYFAPWDWVIGAAYYDSDFAPLQQRMNAALDRMAIWVSCAALLMAIVALPLGWLVADGIRSRVDSILTSVSDILIVTDHNNRIYLLSRAAEEFFGVPLARVKGQSLDGLIAEPQLLAAATSAVRERQNGSLFQCDYPGDKQGAPRTLQGRITLVQDSGTILTLHDISGEREIERLKNELLSTTAHELNTPLTAIIGYSELLIEADLDAATRQESLHYINQKAWALSRIVHDLLDVSRIESGNAITLNCAPCEIGTLIDAVLHYARKLTDKHAFELKLPQEAVVLCLDRDKIEEVLENILSNAIKYSPAGGTIRIHAQLTAEVFELSIGDEGIGMTPTQLQRVFDKFYRADASNTAIHGTGLGMTIVKHIVDAHGAAIAIDSAPGRGTTVRISFPRTAHTT